MAKPGEGDPKADALFILGFFIVLFVLWIGLGGPTKEEDPAPLIFGFPQAPQVATGTTPVPQEEVTSREATSTGIQNAGTTSIDPLFLIALTITILFFAYARYAGEDGGGKK